jgi:hypothetical protein
MYSRIFSVAIALSAIAGAQAIPQRAAMVGGGNPNAGQCTITVVVDGQAEIEIRGSDASMRNLGGAPPQWRRFECTAAMPQNPANFQFAGLNGRGQQNLVSEPRNGGPAVVRIEDSQGAASEYTFRLAWGNYSGGPDRGPSGVRDDRGYQGDRDRRPDMDGYYNDRDAFFRGSNGQAMLFQRVRQDLDHATSGAFPFTGDRARLDRTRMELDELQQKLAHGFYDERQLDETTAALQAVVEGNRLAPRDRAILTDDLNRMRDFRARHDEYGAHFGPNRGGDQGFDRDNRRAMLFQRIREDLDRATSGGSPYRGDPQRLARTKFQLDELQAKMSRGAYDERELNDVMNSLQRVVDSNRLAPRDRDILTEDLRRLDDFRARHESYGAR